MHPVNGQIYCAARKAATFLNICPTHAGHSFSDGLAMAVDTILATAEIMQIHSPLDARKCDRACALLFEAKKRDVFVLSAAAGYSVYF